MTSDNEGNPASFPGSASADRVAPIAGLSSDLATFQTGIGQLQGMLAAYGGDARSLQAAFLQVQQHYQESLSPALLADAYGDRYQPWHTEISRSLRLLGMDVAFLQTALRSPTAQKRRSQMQQRLQALLTLCAGLAEHLP